VEEIKYAIFCVDDDPNILHMLSFQLDKIVDSKKTLLEFFTNPLDSITHFDELLNLDINVLLLIVDFQMPQMNGAQLIRELKKKNKGLTCVMLSGQANSVQVSELQHDKLLHSFINKPWNEDNLFEILKPILSDYTILCAN
jgi:two-component system sensor histidine kinase/response regulator